MSDNTVNTRNTRTGKLQRLTPRQAAVFSAVLEVVPDDAKPYEPGLFKPGVVGEFNAPDAPQTTAVEDAQAAYDAVIDEGHAPNSKAAREAKENLDAAVAKAEADAAAAQAEVDAANKSGDAAGGAE